MGSRVIDDISIAFAGTRIHALLHIRIPARTEISLLGQVMNPRWYFFRFAADRS